MGYHGEMDDMKQWEQQRADFIGIHLPTFDPTSTCYLASAACMALTASMAMKVFELNRSHFDPATDQDEAVRIDSVWTWEEMKQGPAAITPNPLYAASTLPKLLGNFGPNQKAQRAGLETYAALFPTMSLCFNDHLEAGDKTIQEFVGRKEIQQSFLGDETDLQKAVRQGQIWTMVDQMRNRTTVAGSSLEKLLTRAWDHHPVISAHHQLMVQLVVNHPSVGIRARRL